MKGGSHLTNMSKREPRFSVVLRRPRRESFIKVPSKRDHSPVRKSRVDQKIRQKYLARQLCSGPARLYLGDEVVLMLAEGENGTVTVENGSGTFKMETVTLSNKTKEYRCKPEGKSRLIYISSESKKPETSNS